ncbi:MAG TPA: AMP-binding protein, partial [Acidimicrobiales bacterium]|nr:AMP-binding protein [Acidimicrobiales bacterium]
MVSATQRLDESLPRCSSLVDLLQWRAEHQPDRTAYRFLLDGELEADSLTYGQLALRARAIASVLQRLGAKNERALLLFPPGLDYIAAWLGCLYANVVAVPAYPPRAGRSKARIAAIVDDSEPSFVLATEATREREPRVSGEIPGLSGAKWLVPANDVTPEDADHWVDPGATGGTVAFLQYTSGSTSNPKGVVVTHANLVENLRSAREAFGYGTTSSGVSWLPPYHDMGLIGGILHPLYAGFPVVLMPPVAFLQRPARWLEAISRTRATVSAGPGSAYQLCARRVSDEDKAKIDLSSWEVAFNGSEPVRADVLDEFCEAFKSCGFRREAFYPCYGLAEATLLVTGKQRGGDARRWWVSDLALQEGRVVTADPLDAHARLLVSSGQPAPGVRVVIADPQAQTACGPLEIGEIWVNSPSVTGGYWRRSATSGETFRAHLANVDENTRYLRTGDLGVLNDGDLYVTGRLSDLIIIRGKNHYPQDIERTVEQCHSALQPDRGAAFSIDVDGEERLVVVHEAPGQKGSSAELAAVLDAIRRDVAEEHELRPYAVVLIRTRSMPRTSSGKVQRRACRAAFLNEDLEVVAQWRDGRDGEAHERPARRPRPTHVPPTNRGGERDWRAAEIRAWLVQAVAERVGTEANEVDVGQPFTHYGLDSVDAVALSGHLGQWLGRNVEPTLVWDYPTIASAARYLASEEDNVVDGRPTPDYFGEPIAVMGMACRFPGGIESVEAFWEFLRSRGCAVAEVPPDRWDISAFYDADPEARGKMATRYGAFINGIDRFDSLFFGISPREANLM